MKKTIIKIIDIFLI